VTDKRLLLAGGALAVAVAGGVLGPVVGALLIGVFVLAYTVPRNGCLAIVGYIAVRPLVDSFVHTRVDLGIVRPGLGKIWGTGLVVLLTIYVIRERPRRADLRAYTIPIVFAITYAAVTLTRPGISIALTNGSRLVSWLALIYVIDSGARNAVTQRRIVELMYVAASLEVVAVGVAVIRNRYGSTYYDLTLNTLTDQTPFVYAVFSALMLPFLFLAVLMGAPKTLPLVLAGLLGGCVILSYSRASYAAAAFIVAVVIVVGIKSRGRAGSLALAGGALLGLAGIAAVLVHGRVASRFAHGSPRLDLWSEILHGAFHSPVHVLVGGGATFSRAIDFHARGVGYWSHNDFLEVFVAGGALLFVLYLALLGWLGWTVLRVVRDPRQSSGVRDFGVVALAALISFVMVSFFDGIIFYAPALMLALVAGLARAAHAVPGATVLDVPLREAAPAHRLPVAPALL